jgi:ElaB/YqjD/DUF883 family membrane-anchored ribosome-binding protein
MTFESIILKLAPFTYINQSTQEVHWGTWSNLTDGDKIITSVEVFLIFLFTWYMIKLIASWWKDKKQIVILSSLLEKHRNKIKENYPDGHLDISNEYAELLEEINESNPKLQKLWKEFDESLIKKTDGDKFIVRNSIDAEYFFNKKTMISHLGSKLFGSIPGMLLGIGLLGTFTGLYFALIQMDVTNVDKLQESIKVLINMAGVKFAASIWGLGLSVLFTFVDKLLESGLEKRLDRIQIVIDQIFIRETAEQNLDSILLQNTQQTKALNGLATSLTEKIAAEFNTTLIPKIELMNNQFNSMPQHISEAISDTFQKPLEKLSDTVENLTQNQSDKSNEALENLLKGFITELKSAAGDEGEKMKVASEQSQDILKSTSEQLHNTFTSMQKMFQEQESISTSRDNKILEDLQKIKNDQQDMIQNLSSNVSENITNMNNEVSNNINNLVDTIQTISSNQTKLSNDREESLQASQANMVTNLSQSVSDNMNNINSQVSNNINNLVETIQNTNQKQQESSEQRENEITKSVNTMLSNIETSMTSQIEDDKQRNKVVINMLEEIGNQNKELITEISSTVSGKMNSLNNNSKELFEKLISQFDSHIDNVKSSVDSILINLKTEVQNIDTIMSSASKQLVGLPSHLEKVSISTDKLLQFSNDLTESTSKLIQFNSDFVSTQKNLDEYSKNILQSSEELKEADTNLKETLNNSKELLSDMKNQFEELTDKNSKTIDTFGENVDKFMNDYHKHVETAIKDNIVHQLDTSLASYAHTMAEAITSLSDAIDELREKENN